MRILIHDYAGHPFQVELSRSLARRGHDVLHVFSGSNLTPQGALQKAADDPATFNVKPIVLAEQIKKGDLIRRRGQEIEHGERVCREIEAFKPDVMASANSALDSQRLFQRTCDRMGIPMVFWLQDLVGLATMTLLKNRLPVIGWLAGTYYMKMEHNLLMASKGIVAITEDFKNLLVADGIDAKKIEVIENWAPLKDVPLRPKKNEWSTEKGFSETFNFLYSGTLGMKHNPELLLRLAEEFKSNPEVRVIVVSQGPGRKWLEEKTADGSVPNLSLFDFQPFSAVPDMLGAANVVVAILEAEAGALSVPSKVMTYMCSGKPMLLAVPPENLSSRVVSSNETGLTSSPNDVKKFLANARQLFGNDELRTNLGANSRKYAETHFDIEKITDRFEAVFQKAVRK
jgi:glycosyltransferase involved in cell wall biosynthesis